MWIIASDVALGALVGILAGLFGIGGGGVTVPVLLMIFAKEGVPEAVRVHLAIGTSLAAIVFTASSAIIAQHRRGAIDWPIALTLAPATLIGSFASSSLSGLLPALWLKRIFSVCLALIAIQLLTAWRPRAHWRLPGRLVLSLVGLGIGTVSALIGIGGGSLTVPFLSTCGVDMKRAVAISSTLGLPIALFGAIGFAIAGYGHPGLPRWTIGDIDLPALAGIAGASTLAAPLGVHLSHRLPVVRLKRLFGLLLLLVAGEMLLV